MSNYKYAWKHGYKWAWKTLLWSKNPMAFVRVFWAAYVHGNDIESCQDCGKHYILWLAVDDIYLKIHGNFHGTLCPGCFDKQARHMGITLRWKPEILK